MIKYELNFHRYFTTGSLHFTYQIPDEFIEKYPDSVLNTTARVHVWEDKQKAVISVNNSRHILSDLLNDIPLYKCISNSLTSYSEQKKFQRSWQKNASNFFISFINSSDSGKKTKKISSKKTIKSPRTPKIIDETKQTYQQLKSKTKTKIKYIQKMHNWVDCSSIYSKDEQQIKVTYMIFNSYKDFLEENLNARGIKFFVSDKNLPIKSIDYNDPMYLEYTLVDNTENIQETTMNKQGFAKLSLTWFASRKGDRYNRTTILNIKKIGVVDTSGRRAKRGSVKSFQTMKEATFTELINTIYKNNNELYFSKMDSFKTLKSRIAENIIEFDKINDYLSKNIIPFINPKNIKITNIDIMKNPFIVSLSDISRWRELEFIRLYTTTDSLENISINLKFFGIRQLVFYTADEFLVAFDQIFNNDFKTISSILDRIAAIK